MIITIDGGVGTGKSTVAKRLADKLGFIYFDTGAMYRCVTYGVIKHGVDPDNAQQMEQFLKGFSFEFKMLDKEKHYIYEGEDVTLAIRKDAVTAFVSKVSALKKVREILVPLQRKLGENVDAIFEGRDIGTVVFPNAPLKFFLTASPKVRAERRFAELKEKFPDQSQTLTLQDVYDSLKKRDAMDASRELSPLKKAEDAHVIDTSNLTIDEVIEEIIRLINVRG